MISQGIETFFLINDDVKSKPGNQIGRKKRVAYAPGGSGKKQLFVLGPVVITD